MASTLSNLVNNLSEGIIRIECKYGHDNKKNEIYRIKYKYCNCFLECTNFKDDLIEYKCLCYNKNYQQKLDEKLKEQFSNTCKYSGHDNNKLILLLQKSVYPYEYMDYWENNDGKSLPKKGFYNNLNMEDITDPAHALTKRVCKDFEIKNLGELHDLFAQSDTLLLADVFDNFRIMCLKIYELDPAKFISALGKARQAALKKTEVKLDLLTDIDLLLIVEKRIGEEYVTLFINIQKLITNS